MLNDRAWDEQGDAARQADAAALVEREPVLASYQEREERNYWRRILHNNPHQGRDTHRHGYIAPGSDVPGVTPGSVAKGTKGHGKGEKGTGNRSRTEYEGWGSASSSSGRSSGSWWNPGSWSGWWDWSDRR